MHRKTRGSLKKASGLRETPEKAGEWGGKAENIFYKIFETFC